MKKYIPLSAPKNRRILFRLFFLLLLVTVARPSLAIDVAKLDKLCDSEIVNNSFCVKSAEEKALLIHTPSVRLRDGGTAAFVGPWMVWTWGDTFTQAPATQPPRRNILSHTISLSLPDSSAYQIQFENLDSEKRPFQSIPYTKAEADYNDCCVSANERPTYCETLNPRPPRTRCIIPAGKTEGTCEVDASAKCTENKQCVSRIAHWPTVPIETSRTGCETGRTSPTCVGDGKIFYNTFLLVNESSIIWKGTGVATIRETANSLNTVAERVMTSPDNPLYVFTSAAAGDIGFSPSLVEDGYIYFLGSKWFASQPLYPLRVLARVPLGSENTRNMYSFWNGSNWSGSINSLAPTGISIANGSRILWNIYLKQYLFLSQTIDGTKLSIQASPKITGPWSPLIKYFETRPLPPPPDDEPRYGNYYHEAHPEFCRGIRLQSTYYHNTDPFDVVAVTTKIRELPSRNTCLSINAPASVNLGQKFTFRVTYLNRSLVTWGTTTHQVVDYFADRDGPGSAHDFFGVTGTYMPYDVAPNQTVSVDVQAQARKRGTKMVFAPSLKSINKANGIGCSIGIDVR